MIKKSLATILGFFVVSPAMVSAENLMQVYQQALNSDPTYLKAVDQHEADIEGVPIARAALLPSVEVLGAAAYSQLDKNGAANTPIGSYSSRTSQYNLQLTQTVFDMEQWDTLGQANLTLKGSDATYTAAIQDLMFRVASAYFAVLQAREELRYSYTNTESLAKQLDQTEQQYRVGLKTRSDVDLAQASYDSAVANHISTINDLSNARENLRAITGTYYSHIAILRQDLPLITPFPADPNQWVNVATKQNWTLLASKYAAEAAQKGIAINWDNNLPTLSLQTTYGHTTSSTWDAAYQTGSTTGSVATLNLTIPIVEGGLTVADTRQAEYLTQVAQKAYEFNLRDTVNQTRQAYLAILSGISQIQADKQAVISGESALQGNIAGYRVGTKTIVEVLKAQDTLFQSQSQYATDRFNYLTSSIKLKEETGTLSVNDLRAINNWLVESKTDMDSEVAETQQPKISAYKDISNDQLASMPANTTTPAASAPAVPSTAATTTNSTANTATAVTPVTTVTAAPSTAATNNAPAATTANAQQ